MKKTIAFILAVVMVFGCALVAAAGSSKSSSSSSSSSTVVSKSSGTATVSVSGAAASQAASGDWTQAADGTWKFSQGGKAVTNTWALVKNPYSGDAAQWFFFDANGNMLTGWVWIKGADGITRCYYLNPISDGSKGALFMNGTTPDGYSVDASGAWTVNGKVQTK